MARSRRRDDEELDSDPPIQNDAYVGLLGISLVALLAGVIFMYLDTDELKAQTVPQPSVTVSEDGLASPKAAPKS